jgi:competence protein ComEA
VPVIALSRKHVLLLALGLLALLALAGKQLAGTGGAQQPPAAALQPVAAPAVQTRLVVHVVGAVRRPGLYRLREGTRVSDAVVRAGGALRRAELGAINLAAPLADGAQVVVPFALDSESASSPGGAAAAAPKVSLGSATLEQLDELPGIGPVTAQKIVDYRAEHGPLRSVDDLDAIPGIGPARIEQIRDLVTP